MASLLCIPSSLPLTKPNSRLQLQQKPSPVSLSSLYSHARHESQKSVFPLFSPTRQLSSRTSTTAAKSATPIQVISTEQTVEHIVLFTMKEPASTDPRTKEEIEARLIKAMNSLRCLPGVLYLTAGYLQDIHPSSSKYKIFLHSRHATKKDLENFMNHPLKFGFSKTYTEDDHEEYMVMDYVYDRNGPLSHPKKGNALRCTFLNSRKGWHGIQRDNLLKEIAKTYKGAVQQTFGRGHVTPPSIPVEEGSTKPPVQINKGYDLGMLTLYPAMDELIEELGAPAAFAHELNNQLKGAMHESSHIMVVDYQIGQVYDRDNLI